MQNKLIILGVEEKSGIYVKYLKKKKFVKKHRHCNAGHSLILFSRVLWQCDVLS